MGAGVAWLGAYAPSMGRHQFFDNRKSQTGAASLLGGPPAASKKTVEDKGQIGIVDAFAVVDENQLDGVVQILGDHLDSAPG
jgi:hypothetical protein